MLVDGRKIATEILSSVAKDVRKFDTPPCLAAITCAPNFETQKYLEMKKHKAASVGITLKVVELPIDANTADVVSCVDQVAKEVDGVVVQLPMPTQIDCDKVLLSIPAEKDPDSFSYAGVEDSFLPPVTGAIDEISKRYGIDWHNKTVVILGEGRLVGKPTAMYARALGAKVQVLNKENYKEDIVSQADIIVSGIGQPNFIKQEMVKSNVVIFDAGTSEEGGVLVGDVAKSTIKRVSLLTPVPGGIGPITIAYLLKNLVALASQ